MENAQQAKSLTANIIYCQTKCKLIVIFRKIILTLHLTDYPLHL